ncbi:MAG: calcium-binding protein [Arenibacterium sp.]
MKLEKIGTDIILESAGIGPGGRDPDIAVLSDGRIVVAWSEVLQQPTGEFDDTDGAVFARILDADGAALSDIIQVNDFSPFKQDRAHVVSFGDGSFAVGWTTTQKFGDSPKEADTFIRYFDANGAPFNDFKISFTDDNPVNRQELHEIVSLSGNRLAAILEEPDNDGVTAKFYNAGGDLYATFTRPFEDLAELNNGNIVVAGVIDDSLSTDGNVVRVSMFDEDLFSPKNIEGLVDSLVFDIVGVGESDKSPDHVQLAALAGGGFVVGFLEKTSDTTSNLNMVFLSDYGQIEFDDVLTPISLAFDSTNASFDMISLKGGGVAVALSDADASGTTIGVDMLLFDADGKLLTRLQASDTDVGSQGQPTLTELDNGNVMVVFEDLSGGGDTLPSNTLRLAEFSIDGKAGKFVGTNGDDTLRGVGGNDLILGLDGDDKISGQGGNDKLRGGLGDDELIGGTGRDALRGGEGQDNLKGGGGNDGLGGGEGADRLNGGDGNDIVSGGAGNDRLNGAAGDDLLKGGLGDDTLNGGAGDDVFQFVRSRSGDDTIEGFSASDDSLLIDLRGAKASIVDVSTSGGDTLVEFGTASVRLDGVTLTESDITFLYI